MMARYLCRVALASSMVSMPLYREEVEKLKKDLPGKSYEMMTDHEAAGTTDSDEYAKIMKIYFKRHIYRGRRYPKHLHDPKGTFGTVPYEKLWGVSEAYPNGALKDWERLSDLHKIMIPTLVTSGQYDEYTPRQALATYERLPSAQIKIFQPHRTWLTLNILKNTLQLLLSI